MKFSVLIGIDINSGISFFFCRGVNWDFILCLQSLAWWYCIIISRSFTTLFPSSFTSFLTQCFSLSLFLPLTHSFCSCAWKSARTQKTRNKFFFISFEWNKIKQQHRVSFKAKPHQIHSDDLLTWNCENIYSAKRNHHQLKLMVYSGGIN